MSDKTATRRGKKYKAIGPDGKPIEVLIPQRLIRWAWRKGDGAIIELDRASAEVLARPSGVFEGILRDADDDSGHTDGWLCLCGSPDERYNYESGRKIDRGQRVYMVLVNKEHVVYSVRWEEEDPLNPGLPSDLDNRFRRPCI